jgi:hypothetical protein
MNLAAKSYLKQAIMRVQKIKRKEKRKKFSV